MFVTAKTILLVRIKFWWHVESLMMKKLHNDGSTIRFVCFLVPVLFALGERAIEYTT